MCLAVPAKVIEILDDDQALIELGGVRNRVSLALVDGVTVGDYVIVHTGFAITRLDVQEAEKTLALFAEIASVMGESPNALYPRVS